LCSSVESGKLDAGLRGQPLRGSHSRRTGDDFDLRDGNLFSRCVL